MDIDRQITEYQKKFTKFTNLFLTSANITGIPISRKTIDQPKQFSSIPNTDRKIYRPRNYITISTVTNLNKNYFSSREEVKIDKKKLTNIKNLLKKPVHKNYFDYFYLNNKKCTIQYLIKKISSKENKVSFSKNNLCAKNFPLIKILTTKRSFNNSKQLMINLMTAEYGDLTKEQLHTIKYSGHSKTNVLKTKKKKIIKNRPTSFQKTPVKKTRNYEFGKTVNLFNHNTNRNNFDILNTLNDENCFLDKKGKVRQNLDNDKIFEILKDISHLKLNQKIMPLDIKMKTI